MQQEAVKKTKAANTPAVKAQNAIAVAEDFSAGGWDTEVIDTKDIIIPKILLMHPTSDMVKKVSVTKARSLNLQVVKWLQNEMKNLM